MKRFLASRALPWITAALTILVHARSIDAGFVYDDFPYIVENGDVHGGISRLARLMTSSFPSAAPERALYRPLTAATLLLDAGNGPLEPRRFHVTNLVLAGLFVLAAHAALRRLVSIEAAGAAALLLATTPIHVEAIAWITGRSELLASIFACAAIAAALDASRSSRAVPPLLAALFAFAAVLSKENGAIVLPLTFVLLATSATSNGWRRKETARALGPVFLGVGAALVLRASILGRFAPEVGERAIEGGLLARLPLFFAATGEHLRLLVLPWPLSIDRMPNAPRSFGEGSVIAGVIVLAAAGVLALGIAKWRRELLGLALWPAVALLPVMHFVPIGETVAERFLVLPSVGAAGLAGSLLMSPRRGHAVSFLLAALVVGGAGGSLARVEDWRSERRLWERATRAEPRSSAAWAALGDARLRAGEPPAAAISDYRRALALAPGTTVARLNLARALETSGAANEALAEAREAVRLDSDHPVALNHLGARLAREGHRDEARALFQRALAAAPGYGAALRNAAYLAFEEGDSAAAHALLRHARTADPNLPGLDDLEGRLSDPSPGRPRTR